MLAAGSRLRAGDQFQGRVNRCRAAVGRATSAPTLDLRRAVGGDVVQDDVQGEFISDLLVVQVEEEAKLASSVSGPSDTLSQAEMLTLVRRTSRSCRAWQRSKTTPQDF